MNFGFNKASSGLKRMYGYFQCSNCQKEWESSHVYCVRGTTTAQYGQECKDCKMMCKPYKVERLICSVCGYVECICDDEDRERHIDPNKHHRSDLCAKCRAGFPCV